MFIMIVLAMVAVGLGAAGWGLTAIGGNPGDAHIILGMAAAAAVAAALILGGLLLVPLERRR